METTGNQTLSTTESLTQEQLGKILTGLHAQGLDQDEIERIIGAVKKTKEVADNRPAEMEVIEWEPLPALLSDNLYTFGAGSMTKTVKLKILPGSYYISQLLPQLEEWTTAIYREDSLSVLQESSKNPMGFMFGLFKNILQRPKNDRIKVSFYQLAAATFSTPEVEITPEFFEICPPDQQLGSIMRLVETNRTNFINFWADTPSLLKKELTLLYITLMNSIQMLNQNVISTIKLMTQDFQQYHLSGGHENTGRAGSGDWPVESLENTVIS